MVRVLVLVVLAGCLKSDSVECSNGVTCPRDRMCDLVNGGCIVAEQQTACAPLMPGDACTWPEGNGQCVNGVCLPQICGDGRRSGSERCDPTDDTANTSTCTSVELGYYQGGDVTCTENCAWDTTPCSEYCGDGVINGNELCENDIAPTESCVDYAFDRGTLVCGKCVPAFEQCGFIGWRRRVLPARPSRAIAIGPELYVALDRTTAPHLAAHFVGGGWIGLGTFATTETPTSNAIAGTDPSNVWVGGATNTTGDAGFVARYDGSSWTRIRTFTSSVTALWASGSHVFVMAGSELFIYDGANWTSQTLTANANGYWISGTSANDVWIGGGKLWHGGATTTFTEVALPVTGTVSGVHAFGPDQVVAAVYESTGFRFGAQVRENGVWRSVLYPTGTSTTMKIGVPYARAGNDIYMFVADLPLSSTTTVISHHDGSTWHALTDSSHRPTALAGSADAIFAVERDLETAQHYGGAAWVAKAPPPSAAGQLSGFRPDDVFAPDTTDGFFTMNIFDGAAWNRPANPRGTPDVSGNIMYVMEPNFIVNNPRLWYRNNLNSWSSVNLPNGTEAFAQWLGVLGMNDLFIKELVTGGPRYHHWGGNVTNEAPLETTNITDGEQLDHIDCRSGIGCYAGGATALWRTPGDRNSWEKVASFDGFPITAIWLGGPSLIAIGSTQGRITVGDGTTWTTTQLPTAQTGTVIAIVGSSATDAFVLTKSAVDEHRLFHFNGDSWSRVRTPVQPIGSTANRLWSNGRITYFGGNTPSPYFYALVRTEPW